MPSRDCLSNFVIVEPMSLPLTVPLALDNNATTACLPEVQDVIARCQRDAWGNPGSRHLLGRNARRVLEDAREAIAAILGAQPDELIFTSGGTESNNLALFGLASATRGRFAIGAGEHPATAEAATALLQQGWSLTVIPVDEAGRLDSSLFNGPDRKSWSLVSLLYAHNETGVIQSHLDALFPPLTDAGVAVHLDGVQAVGKIPVHFGRLGVTALSFAAHKFHGPRGIGGLLVKRGTRLVPRLFGGHQEQARRPGTEPVPLIAGMAKALELWQQSAVERTARMTRLRDRLEAELATNCGPIVINGHAAPRLPNTSNISFVGLDGEALLVNFDLENVCCSLGSACASGSAEPSPILVAMGLPANVVRSAVRFSLSSLTTDDEITAAVERITLVVRRLRVSGPHQQ